MDRWFAFEWLGTRRCTWTPFQLQTDISSCCLWRLSSYCTQQKRLFIIVIDCIQYQEENHYYSLDVLSSPTSKNHKPTAHDGKVVRLNCGEPKKIWLWLWNFVGIISRWIICNLYLSFRFKSFNWLFSANKKNKVRFVDYTFFEFVS